VLFDEAFTDHYHLSDPKQLLQKGELDAFKQQQVNNSAQQEAEDSHGFTPPGNNKHVPESTYPPLVPQQPASIFPLGDAEPSWRPKPKAPWEIRPADKPLPPVIEFQEEAEDAKADIADANENVTRQLTREQVWQPNREYNPLTDPEYWQDMPKPQVGPDPNEYGRQVDDHQQDFTQSIQELGRQHFDDTSKKQKKQPRKGRRMLS
jgi:hypothetical protein